ncbi:MAG: 23S rRNA (pseudouridine(1915)-N(3))-methyltransferase RlmH [Bacteroidales bacterium]|nr:23S rRNA (pseudouridine(1915)-N(3))-methyltransferase RlmH [Bacteroidales bacterium]
MKITLLTVGKTDVRWVREGLDLYVSRLRHYVPFALTEIPELKNVSALTQDQIKEREGELILAALRPADEVILLDERGRQYRSVEFARFLEDRMARGGRDLVFVVGGAYGFSQKVYDRAAGRISLSDMTFSHQMVRTIFAEQLYRAFTILRGEPYHHE